MLPFPNLSPIGTVTKISAYWLTRALSPIYRLSNAGQKAATSLLKPNGGYTRGFGKTVPRASSVPRIRRCGRSSSSRSKQRRFGRNFCGGSVRRRTTATLLQFVEFLHFGGGFISIPLLPVESRQTKMCLRRERTFPFDSSDSCPRRLSGFGLTDRKIRLAERIERLGHIRP